MPPKQIKQSYSSAAEQLIDAGEELYGLYGLEGVSLRRIGQHAGMSNNYAVQYHFGDAAGLIKAIVNHRAPKLEQARIRRLRELRKQGPLTTRMLFDALLTPTLDLVNMAGERTFARFNLALCNTPSGVPHLVELRPKLLASAEIIHLIKEENPHLSVALAAERVRLAANMFLSSVFTRYPHLDREALDQDLIDNALDMAGAAVGAPVGAYGPRISKAIESLGPVDEVVPCVSPQ